MAKKAVKYFIHFLFLPFWWIIGLLPRDKKIWVFGAWYGERFTDNSMYLFKHLQDNSFKIKPVWITKNEEVVSSNGDTDYLIYKKWSLKGIWYCLRAKYVFVTSRKQDVNEFFVNGATLVNLWHGSPLKKIGADDRYSKVDSFLYKKVVRYVFPILYEFNYDYTVSNSSIFTHKMASSFKLNISHVFETGCPRNDVFFTKRKDSFNLRLLDEFPNSKLVYYLPTFRNSAKPRNIFAQKDYNEEELERFLEKENMVLVSKGHFVESKPTIVWAQKNSRLIHLSDSDIGTDINYMLKDADALITDYSSVFFDFLLLERPIVFAAIDLEEYMADSRELYFDYKEAVAGPIAKNWDEILFHLKNIWDDSENLSLLRQKNKVYNKYHDSGNSKRVMDAIIELF